MVENMSRWLRSVRPSTASDEDWIATPAAAEQLAAVHRRIGPASTAKEQRRSAAPGWVRGRVVRKPRVWLAASGLACAVTIAALISSGGTATPPHGGITETPHLPAIRPAALLLSNYSSCADVLAGLRTHAAASVGSYGWWPDKRTDIRFGIAPLAGRQQLSAGPAATSAAAGDTSTTNVQESGVDEPDLVKTDGGRLITITDGVLRMVDTASRAITGSLDLTMYQGWQNAQLLVGGDHALVTLGGSNNGYNYGSFSNGPAAASGPRSTYLFLDLAGGPKITGSLRAAGSYLDARLIGSTVRLVMSSAPSINLPLGAGSNATRSAANQAVIRQAPLSAWLPQYSITSGQNTTDYTVPCDQVSHPAAYTAASMLTIYTLDLNHLGVSPKPVSVAADGDTVYATSTSLYIASNPNWCCATAAKAQQTEIHRFDITGSGQPTYLGSGGIPGRLLSRYSLSDYAGSLRIATTAGAGGSATQSSSLYILDANTLKVTGRVGGLGKDEQIYAVRFIGPVAYVVTFRRTDPLYVVDLHDPAAPMLVGTLQLTGYSDYLHDAGSGRLIGIGQQASKTGRVSGLQVSLFDVSKPAQPLRTAQVVRSDAPGGPSLDPHAFLYWPPTGLIVTPVQSWRPGQSGKVLVLKVSGTKLNTVGLLANPLAAHSIDDGLGIQRSLIVNATLWTVSGSGVQVSDPATLSRQAWIPFD
ncbi:MAG: hypothetical protein QOH56_2119 [Pseudonocardiales bacterium]|nr:hypothetical protein [Pseudonocardiales bacterium]